MEAAASNTPFIDNLGFILAYSLVSNCRWDLISILAGTLPKNNKRPGSNSRLFPTFSCFLLYKILKFGQIWENLISGVYLIRLPGWNFFPKINSRPGPQLDTEEYVIISNTANFRLKYVHYRFNCHYPEVIIICCKQRGVVMGKKF